VCTGGAPTNSGSITALPVDVAFLTIVDDLMYHSTAASTVGAAGGRFVVFSPQVQSTYVAFAEKYLTNKYSNYTTYSGKLARTPAYCYTTDTTPNSFLGRLRDISVVKNMPSNAVVRDSSNNIVGFSFGQNETTANNAMLLNYS
jgi:hypothetical protein